MMNMFTISFQTLILAVYRLMIRYVLGNVYEISMCVCVCVCAFSFPIYCFFLCVETRKNLKLFVHVILFHYIF